MKKNLYHYLISKLNTKTYENKLRKNYHLSSVFYSDSKKKDSRSNEILFFRLNRKNDFKSNFTHKRLELQDLHLSFPKTIDRKNTGEYHVTLRFLNSNKNQVIHIYYNQEDVRIKTTFREGTISRKDKAGIRAATLYIEQIINDAKILDKYNLNSEIIEQLTAWAEIEVQPLINELKKGYIPTTDNNDSYDVMLHPLTLHFSHDFWPNGIKNKQITDFARRKLEGRVPLITELVELGAFNQDEQGLRLYQIISEKIADTDYNILAFLLAVQELIKYNLLTLHRLEVLALHPSPRDLAFALTALKKNGVPEKYYDNRELLSHKAPGEVANAVIILHQFNLITEPGLERDKLVKEISAHPSPQSMALLLAALSYLRQDQKSRLKEADVRLASKHIGPQFLQACFKVLEETEQLPNLFSLETEVQERIDTLIAHHPEKTFLEQVFFLISYKLHKQLSPSLVESVLRYSGSMEVLYEAVLLLIVYQLLDKEEAISYIQLLLQSSLPTKTAYALITLNDKNILSDANLRHRLIPLLQKTNIPPNKLATNLVLLDSARLLSVDILPLISHFAKLNIIVLTSLVDAKSLFDTHERRSFYVPLIMNYSQPNRIIKIFNSFHNKKETQAFFSRFNQEKTFFEKFHKIAVDDASFLDKSSFLSILNRWIDVLYQHPVDADLNTCMDVIALLYENDPQFFYKPQTLKCPVQHLLAACQKFINYGALTMDVLNQLLKLPQDKMQEIAQCNSKHEIFNRTNDRARPSQEITPYPGTNPTTFFNNYGTSISFTANSCHGFYDSSPFQHQGFFPRADGVMITQNPIKNGVRRINLIKIETSDGDPIDISTLKRS